MSRASGPIELGEALRATTTTMTDVDPLACSNKGPGWSGAGLGVRVGSREETASVAVLPFPLDLSWQETCFGMRAFSSAPPLLCSPNSRAAVWRVGVADSGRRLFVHVYVYDRVGDSFTASEEGTGKGQGWMRGKGAGGHQDQDGPSSQGLVEYRFARRLKGIWTWRRYASSWRRMCNS